MSSELTNRRFDDAILITIPDTHQSWNSAIFFNWVNLIEHKLSVEVEVSTFYETVTSSSEGMFSFKL